MAVIEVTTFRLRQDAGEEEFLAADRAVQTEFIPNHPGFFRRTTAQGSAGQWMVMTLWATAENADASAARAVDHAVIGRLMSLVDPTTVSSARYTTLD